MNSVEQSTRIVEQDERIERLEEEVSLLRKAVMVLLWQHPYFGEVADPLLDIQATHDSHRRNVATK